jgi:hypothetical protein
VCYEKQNRLGKSVEQCMMRILFAKVNVLLSALANGGGIIIQNFKEPGKTVAKFELVSNNPAKS